MQPGAYLVTVTDTRVTQYAIHADSPGEAVRDCAARAVQVYEDSTVTAKATPMPEEQYDQLVSQPMADESFVPTGIT